MSKCTCRKGARCPACLKNSPIYKGKATGTYLDSAEMAAAHVASVHRG